MDGVLRQLGGREGPHLPGAGTPLVVSLVVHRGKRIPVVPAPAGHPPAPLPPVLPHPGPDRLQPGLRAKGDGLPGQQPEQDRMLFNVAAFLVIFHMQTSAPFF